MVHFIQKNIAIDLLVEHVDNLGSRCDRILQAIDDFDLTLTMPTIKCLVSGLEDHALKHGNVVHKKCQSCFTNRDHLYIGSGLASNTDNIRGAGQTVEAAIVIAPVSSQPCCWSMNCLTSQVMYFQDFMPCSISQPALHALTSIDWQNYGLRLRGNFVDGDDIAVLEWEDNLFARMDIALHVYHKIVTLVPSRQRIAADRNLVKKAVKIALDDLKAKYSGLFLSTHALKIRKHAPELSRTIAKLIMSSNDLDFQSECATLLGLHPFDAGSEGVVEACIRGKIIKIVEMNDIKPKAERDAAPCLFKSECQSEEDCGDEENEGAEEDVSVLDF
ncbi:type 2 DNA topoisomerase 6 subunit B-like isoform X2 [Phoenix dactylifera]|uniref:Type 2 DNA topoisomerase 6 subunit B-like isoform X2 n=1 Tax=Phoenix dactylifera TaxID=42345 RepID=A0A8B9AB84_PHODC|nr:type 2 DNA topoisomerase 6 subunit B-like isoform X2 [Phoenix dactylifera]